MRKYGIFGILFLSLCLFGAVHTAYAAEEEESLQITQEELLDEFDFSDLDDSLKKMFPREKMTFRDVVETLVSGDLKKAGEQFTGFLFDQFFYELQTHRKLLVYLILIAVIAAVFANFSGAFGERQASEIAFYILYMLLWSHKYSRPPTARPRSRGRRLGFRASIFPTLRLFLPG